VVNLAGQVGNLPYGRAMKALDRKLLRDLWGMKGQAVAICLVMACGVATFVMSRSAYTSLQFAQSTYYERYRFADVFASLKRAPNDLRERIASIPGVARVQTRVVVDVTLDVPGRAEPGVGRLISVPEKRAPGLNDLHLRRGRWVEPGRGGEVLVSEGFADAHQLNPGDTLRAIINGRQQQLRVVGVALSPEYIFSISAGDLMPDNKRFGVFWMGYEELAGAFDMRGAFNDVALTLMPGASEPEVVRRLDRLTAPYGGLGAYGRADQLSNRFLTSELRGLRGMALVAPLIFLGVAAFLLNVVLSRQVNTQREEIAALKAFGYTGGEVGWHYLKLVLLLVAAGAALGTLAGAWLGYQLTQLYTRFYQFPVFTYRLDPLVVVLALLISGGASVAGTLGAVRRAVRLPPAEAMRPEPPASFRPTLVERFGLGRLLSPATRMVLRQIERHPVKTLFSVLGIATATGVVVLGNCMGDAVDSVIETQFALTERQDVTVTFAEVMPGRALHELEHLPGVRRCEPFRSVSARLRAGHRARQVGILGLDPDGELHRVMDVYRRDVDLPPDGVVLSETLARILGVRAGDTLTVEVLEGERPVREVPVRAVMADFAGLSAYMDLRALHRLMREDRVLSGAYLAVDPHHMPELYARLKATPRVAGVAVKQSMLDNFNATVAKNMLIMKFFNVLFAVIIACGVVYNGARVALAERSRELATLRVIGFTRLEISAIFLGELAVLTLAAIPVGFFFGLGFAHLMMYAQDVELFGMPLVVYRSTYGFAAAVVLGAAVASGLVVRRRLDHLDLVAVLKMKE
jgi:putative ABC transport system permease protein